MGDALVAPRWPTTAYLRRRVSTVVAPLHIGLSISACYGLTPLIHFWYQAWRRCVRSRTGCAMCIVPVLLVSRLVVALEGRGIAPIGWSTGRFALSVRPWNQTWEPMIGARVNILDKY